MNSLEIDHRGAFVLVGLLRIPLTTTGAFSPFHPLDLERWLPHADRIVIYRLNFLTEPLTAMDVLRRIRSAPAREDVEISGEELLLLARSGLLGDGSCVPGYYGYYAGHRIIPPKNAPAAELRSFAEITDSIRLVGENDGFRRDNADLLERAKSAERAVANLRAKLAALTGTTDPVVEPRQPPNRPVQIPKSEFLKLQQEVIRLQQELLQAKQESSAAQTLWHAVSNECEGLRADVKTAEAQFEVTDKLLALRTKERDEARSTREYLTTELNKARKELEELRTRVRNSLRAPDGFYKT